jgi:hypothetical protein
MGAQSQTVELGRSGDYRSADDTGRRLLVRAGTLAAAFLFFAHGIAHLVGFTGAWSLTDPAKAPKGFTFVEGFAAGSWPPRAVALLWLAGLALFVAAATGLVLRRRWWRKVAFAAVGASEVACVLWLVPSKVGTALNVAILAGLVVSLLVPRRRETKTAAGQAKR